MTVALFFFLARGRRLDFPAYHTRARCIGPGFFCLGLISIFLACLFFNNSLGLGNSISYCFQGNYKFLPLGLLIYYVIS
ncbi:hypothetical protein RchiOBHm_Chr4g0418251 [Rosa chinensis]|uniref:Uncharacterized protein n=1 Tax=Rosa chinensis TaxID=74649 RepID=A0A2P6QXD3_ROSCH|nr:hypothetical protein RchiOBHm_Chr4g0418251 [Rosa chinensis]